MFFKLFALFAVLAVAFANPNPKPEPQVLTYAANAAYPYAGYSPVAYSAPYVAAGYSGYPYAYSGYYVR